MHQSVAVLKSPEFINLAASDISPFVAECQIKVLYLGENRNRSYISKEQAEKMSKTLRGSPIAGYYKEENEDFRDHGEEVVMDADGIHFNKKTKPYGFVAPDAKVWFQDYEDTDEAQGKVVTRTYMVTTGYLWLKQFPECEKIFECGGKGQSMELDAETLNGVWSNEINPYVDFFIINDATFSQLCILGDDVEPCFEGANVTPIEKAPQEPTFVCSLFTMMKDLQFALEGGLKTMENENKLDTVETEVTENFTETEATETTEETVADTIETPATENFEDNSSTTTEDETQEEVEGASSDFAKKEEEDKTSDEDKSDEDKKDDAKEDEEDKKAEDDEAKKKYELLQAEYTELENKYNLLKTEYDALAVYKNEAESAQKQELLNSFSLVLSEEDIAKFSDLSQYSLDELESKLSVLESRQRRASAKEQSAEVQTPAVTFNLEGSPEEANVPDFVKALKAMKEKMN